MAHVQRRRHGGEHRRVPARDRALGGGSAAGERPCWHRLWRAATRVERGHVTLPSPGTNGRIFWGAAISAVVADYVTKLLAEKYLFPPHVPHRVIGDVVRLTLAYNPGAAFSMSLGAAS